MAGTWRVWSWVLAVALLALLAGAPAARADDDGVRLDIALDLKSDGSLSVNTTITVPAGASATDRLPLDIPVELNRIQHFDVTNLKAASGADAAVDGRTLRIIAPAGTSTVSYTVRGSVADGADLQQFTWVLAAGWSAPVSLAGSFTSPSAKPDSPICAYGSLGERRLCSLTQIDPQGQVTFRNQSLPVGSVALFSILMPAGTTVATARFDSSAAAASTASRDVAGFVGAAAAVLIALGLAGFGWLRRRADDTVAHTAGATAPLLVPWNGEVVFASPDAVLPGQVGMLTTGRARPADIGATILDLAVRNYLWIAELPGEVLDVQISRRGPLDSAVTGYERAVLDAILPDGRESIAASELTYRLIDLAAARSEIAASVTESGWVRGHAGRLERLGFAVLGIGLLAAVVLPAAGLSPLWAVAVAVLGAGVAAADRLQPVRTPSGSRLAAAVAGMREYLVQVDPADVMPASQPVLFERALPYAHALGNLGDWLGRWGQAGPDPEWYQPASDRPLPAGVLALAATLDGVAAHSEAAQQR